MIGIDIALGCCAVAVLVAVHRIVVGPTAADRVVAADLLSFAVIGLVALIGVRAASEGAFDLVLVMTLVAFLAAVSLARALARGHR